jgi:hypothetical protein
MKEAGVPCLYVKSFNRKPVVLITSTRLAALVFPLFDR